MRTFGQALAGDSFAITAELTLKRESTADDLRRQADLLGGHIDAFQVTDNPYAWVHLSALAASGILLGHGVDAVPILTCRDRNRSALRSELLGLRALGGDSVILMRGPKVPKRHPVRASTVFDLSGRELVSLAAGLFPERRDGFHIGIAARAFRPRKGWQGGALKARIKAGAHFLQTQLCFNTELLSQYLERLAEAGLSPRYPVVVSLAPLPSAATASWLQKTMTDARVPDSLIARIEGAADPEKEGVRICAELMQAYSEMPGVSGVNLMTVGEPGAILSAIEASGLGRKL